MLFSFSSQSLSATTASSIIGNAPTFSSQHQTDIDIEKFSLLQLAVVDSSGRVINSYTSDKDPAYQAKIDSIPHFRQTTLDDIIQLLASDVPAGTLAGKFVPIQAGDAIDNDEDDNFLLTPAIISIGWYYIDATGSSVKITDTSKNVCELISDNQYPYIKISTPRLSLETQYGNPNNSIYYNVANQYKIKPSSPSVCFAAPSIVLDTVNNPTKWRSSYGFLPQDISTPSLNFPTIGYDGVSFTLSLIGATGEEAKNATAASGVITGPSGNVEIIFEADAVNKNKLKITLTGPSENAPGAFLPFDTIIRAPASTGGMINIYSFHLKKWFLIKSRYSSGGLGSFVDAQNYCSSNHPGYRLPTVPELTNASSIPAFGWTGLWSDLNVVRAIDEGFYAEWGYTNPAVKDNHVIWSSTPGLFRVYVGGGEVRSHIPSVFDGLAGCITPI